MVQKTGGYNDFISLLRSHGFDWLANEIESDFDQLAKHNFNIMSKEEGQIRFCAALSYLYLVEPFNYVHRAAVIFHAMRVAKGEQAPVPLTFSDEARDDVFNIVNLSKQNAHYKKLSEILLRIIREPYPPSPHPGGTAAPPPSSPPRPTGGDSETFLSEFDFGRP